MKRNFLIALVGSMLLSLDVVAQDAKAAIDAAAKAMGTTSLQSIQYSGTGSVFMFGQAPGPGAPWPRFRVIKYINAINYNTPALREELVRVEVENPPRGGGAGGFNPATGQGGMRPQIGEQTVIRQATARTDAGLLDIWMTPHGFLRAAAENAATANVTTTGGKKVISFSALGGKHTVTGTLNDQHLVERVETLVDNTVLGDTPVEFTYSDYKDFGGVKFPTRIVRREAGHPTLDLTISSVQPNGAATLEVRENPQQGTPAPVRAEAQKVAEGVWEITAAGLHPRPGAPPLPSPPQFTVNLVDNVRRLKLDAAQVLHIHGGIDPFATVATAAGRQAR